MHLFSARGQHRHDCGRDGSLAKGFLRGSLLRLYQRERHEVFCQFQLSGRQLHRNGDPQEQHVPLPRQDRAHDGPNQPHPCPGPFRNGHIHDRRRGDALRHNERGTGGKTPGLRHFQFDFAIRKANNDHKGGGAVGQPKNLLERKKPGAEAPGCPLRKLNTH